MKLHFRGISRYFVEPMYPCMNRGASLQVGSSGRLCHTLSPRQVLTHCYNDMKRETHGNISKVSTLSTLYETRHMQRDLHCYWIVL